MIYILIILYLLGAYIGYAMAVLFLEIHKKELIDGTGSLFKFVAAAFWPIISIFLLIETKEITK